MSTKTKLMIGLGALGTLLAVPFAVSSCQTTGTQHEDTMMNVGTVDGNSVQACPCTETDKEQKSQHASCRGSCGGEDSDAGF